LLEPAASTPIRHALEVRHESFRDKRFITLLRRSGVALVVSDAPNWPRFEDVTADFLYLRLHGAKELYSSGYDDEAVDFWASRIASWAAGGEPEDIHRLGPPAGRRRSRDIYAYFDNDAKVRAPADALALAAWLGVNTSTAPSPSDRSGAESRIM
jgi:uncharacterized protein YecE (DUF72 family)